MYAEEYLAGLQKALDEYRFKDVGRLNDGIAPADFQDKQIRTALNLHRRKRLFAELERVAGVFVMGGRGTPVVRRQYAQALLDQNRITPALGVLQAMLPEVEDDPREGPEVKGLIGRAYKQLYVNVGNSEDLIKAIRAYSPCWKSRQGDYRWHGINLAALIARAVRDRVDPQSQDEPLRIARAIRDEIEESASGAVWDYGTALEASVALGDPVAALAWAGKYVKHPDADAFELGSTLRQLKEVWRLESTPLGSPLLPVIEYAMLQRSGAVLAPTSMTSGSLDRTGFEAVWGSDSYVFLEWLDTLYQRCASIARVFDANTGKRWGTGFLVQGDTLNPGWGTGPVFVTNAHVVSWNPADEPPLRPDDASAEFTRVPGSPKAKLGGLLYSSARIDLDVSVLRIEAPRGSSALIPSDYLPVLPKAGADPQRLYVIGHPNGGELAVSLYDNSLAGYEGSYVHYRSPTEGGQSGSPVFTRQLKLIALHHRAREELQLNEGVCLGPIRKAAATPLAVA
jgi:Trypsin-like peptidase domain/MAP3K TRAFs-binding domain